MTRLEFTELFESELKPLWTKWQPENPLVDLYTREFSKYETADVLEAFRRHKLGQDYQEPKIPLVIKHLRAVIGERKAEERKTQTGTVWPGQVFAVIHHDLDGKVSKYWDFHIPTANRQVPRDFESRRMDQHIETVKSSYTHLSGNFSGEIHTEESWQRRLWEIRDAWKAEKYGQQPAAVGQHVLTGDEIPF